MANQAITKHLNAATHNTRITALMNSLRKKLQNFQVLDREGRTIGEVKDLVLDAKRQLSLVVSNPINQQGNQVFLILSKLIKQIDAPSQRVFIDISKSEIDFMPEYGATEIQGSQPLPNSASAEVPTNVELTTEEVTEQDIIRLLGERLVVETNKRKVGEIIVRKKIETRMIQVPVRRETLIVEQVNPERKQLAEIELNPGEQISGIDLSETEVAHISRFANGLTVSGEFDSPKIASLLLNAIALEKNHGCQRVRIEIVVENEEQQKTYQEWFNRTSKNPVNSAEPSPIS